MRAESHPGEGEKPHSGHAAFPSIPWREYPHIGHAPDRRRFHRRARRTAQGSSKRPKYTDPNNTEFSAMPLQIGRYGSAGKYLGCGRGSRMRIPPSMISWSSSSNVIAHTIRHQTASSGQPRACSTHSCSGPGRSACFDGRVVLRLFGGRWTGAPGSGCPGVAAISGKLFTSVRKDSSLRLGSTARMGDHNVQVPVLSSECTTRQTIRSCQSSNR